MSLTDSGVNSRADALLHSPAAAPDAVLALKGLHSSRRFRPEGYISTHANVAKLADAQDLGLRPARFPALYPCLDPLKHAPSRPSDGLQLVPRAMRPIPNER